MGIRQKLAKVADNVGLDRLADQIAFVWGKRSNGTRGHHVLIAPPGGGNIGDQAMVEAFVDGVAEPVVVVVKEAGSILIPARLSHRMTVVELPLLVYGRRNAAHYREMATFGRICRSAFSVAVVGADMMDGGYVASAASRRASLVALTQRSSIPTRVLGFSWSGKAAGSTIRSLRRAAEAGVTLLARDIVSLERLQRDRIRAVESADIVFTAHSTDDAFLGDFLAEDSRPVAILNASALIGRKLDQTAEYVVLCRLLNDLGYRVVMLPHVLRKSGSDLDACKLVADMAAAEGIPVILIDRALAPAQVRSLCSKASVVVTGRMHLAIMSLDQGIPAIILSTQGKVEGLVRMFGIDEFCIEPEQGFSAIVAPLIRRLHDGTAERETVADRLPGIRRLAQLNFDGLVEPTEVADRVGAS